MNKVLTIIVTYNAMKWAERCFSSLRKTTVSCDVFVVDNGSKDGTQDYIKSNYPDFIFYQSESNLGFGKANNIGLEYALKNGYDYVYLLNQDAWIYENTFESLIDIHKRNPQFGILSPIQCNESLSLFDENFYHLCLKNNIVFEQLYEETPSEVFETDFIMAAHWLISRDCLLKVGGFSPSFPHYGEDDNFVHRSQFHGFKLGITFNQKVVHDRENRTMPITKLLYLQYIHFIADMSNPNIVIPSIFTISWNLLKSAVKYRSIIPIKYICKIVLNRSEIIKNREISIKGFAFLN